LFDLVQTMAVVTGRRILVAGHDGLAVNRVNVVFVIIVAAGTLGNDFSFVIIPVSVGMDVIVAGSAGHIVQLMYA
jgi:hypothetical protein